MLFKKYQLVVFKDKNGSCSTFSLRGWLILFTLLLFVAMAGSNFYLWQYYQEHRIVSRQLDRSKDTVNSQKIQLTTLFHKIQELEKSLERVQELDGKLRVMLNLEPPMDMNPNPAGGTSENLSSASFPFYRQEMLTRQMHSFLDRLRSEARLEEVKQQEILHALHKQRDLLSSTPSIWPTQGWVSSEFGYRSSPFTGQRELHKGLDISAPEGTPIYAPASGVVTFTGRDGAYGIAMELDHGRGITTKYAHLQRYVTEENTKVSRGELIGYVGNTGRSTGPHLHYEVRVNNIPVDPKRYILN
ncbi:M23 family metallopeptidase [Desulfonatronospira sp.]|uniref:M23 family metallopeptidase n=1 Tax=Desulfonatronospira sp. TaxID=1962951 RepID=UPI0025BE4570|nr:M23 family metallopeptidase [Desulfonatronospira sp.]